MYNYEVLLCLWRQYVASATDKAIMAPDGIGDITVRDWDSSLHKGDANCWKQVKFQHTTDYKLVCATSESPFIAHKMWLCLNQQEGACYAKNRNTNHNDII
jgi:hypothetical protein